ncbi:hypothetical protein A2U01_0085877 [Trifolium medium]|uniref:Uncharacterized protein n=1 Tax=Trifolium medium TaxID=97028 RepID=A0A392TUL5_9FABA|nr:hypothetical protein [Trifolium medium]
MNGESGKVGGWEEDKDMVVEIKKVDMAEVQREKVNTTKVEETTELDTLERVGN